MRALPAVLLAAVMLASGVAAAVPTPVRCNQAYCFSVWDGDGDGVPDSVVGGTSEFVHGAPVVNVAVLPGHALVSADVLVGDEEDERSFSVLPDAAARYDDGGLRSVYAEVAVDDFNGQTGESTPLAWATFHLNDSDRDGVPENLTYEVSPHPPSPRGPQPSPDGSRSRGT